MADPVIELGAQAIATQLATITEANGYLTEVHSVIRPRARTGLSKTSVEHLDVLMKQLSRRVPDEGSAASRSDWLMPFALLLVLAPSDEDETPADTYLNCFMADVEKCLMANEAAWAFDGRINWWLDGPDPMPEGVEYDGGMITLNVVYRHNYGDPYTAGG